MTGILLKLVANKVLKELFTLVFNKAVEKELISGDQAKTLDKVADEIIDERVGGRK